MATVRNLLESNPSLNSIYDSINVLKDRLIYIGSLLEEDIDFQKKLLGVNLANVFTTNLNDIIVVDNVNGYTFSSGHKIRINANNLISDNSDLVKHSDVINFLNNYVKYENIFTEAIPKNSTNSNVLNQAEVSALPNVYRKKESPIFIGEAKTELIGTLEDESFINFNFFKNAFFNKENSTANLSLTIKNGDNVNFDALGQALFKDTLMKEIILDYTKTEIEGAGAKLSDFIEKQKGVAPTPGVYDVMIKVLSPAENTLTINGNTYTYTPDPENDTLDDVAQNITGDIDIDGVDFDFYDGYYYATPEDGDNEYKIAWYAKDTAENKTYHVTLQKDDSSSHDLEVDWDSDKGTLTVTYPSDGSQSSPVKLGDLMDAIANTGAPIYIVIIKSDITTDTDYLQVYDTDLNQCQSLIKFTSNNGPLTISYSPSNITDVSTEQEFVEGKHQEGSVGCIRFERGYKFFIKIDDKEIDIDLTDNSNYPNIKTAHDLMDEFSSLISSNNLPFTTTLSDNNLILLASDYKEHTITTSGASDDYAAPLPRTVTVVNDLQDLVRQGENGVILYKGAATSLSKVSLTTPMTPKDIQLYTNLGVFATKEQATNITINNDSYLNDKELPKMVDVLNIIDEILTINPLIFPSKKIKYICDYDMIIDAKLDFPAVEKIGKWRILTESKNEFVSKRQLSPFMEISLSDLQKDLMGLNDDYLSNEIKTISPYIENDRINTLNDLKNTPNKNGSLSKVNTFKLIPTNLAEAYVPVYPVLPDNIIRGGLKNSIEKFLDIRTYDYNLNYYDYDDDEDFSSDERLKHTLFSLVLTQQSPNALMQLSYLLGKYEFTTNDILLHIDNSFLRNTVLDLNTPEATPEPSYGLDGQDAEGTISYSDLYIRQYKNAIINMNSSTKAADYIKIDINSLATPEKLMMCFPMPFAFWDSSNSALVYTNDKYILGGSFYWNSGEERQHTVFDDLTYKDNVIHGLFPVNEFLTNKIGSGLTKYKDTVWNLLIKSIHFIDDSTIAGVQDSLSTIRMLYAKYTVITDWELAYFLAGNWGGTEFVQSGTTPGAIFNSNLQTQESALVVLCLKVWEYIKVNNVASDKYIDTFNALVGLLFKNDSSATGILPADVFNAFLGTIGAADYSLDQADVAHYDFKVSCQAGVHLGHYTLTVN